MTVIQLRGRSATTARPAFARLASWLHLHYVSLLIVIPLVVGVGVLNAWNVGGFPGPVNDDEGTYVSQAWAILAKNELAHYTYWYDHPPLGWAQISAWAWLTDGFDGAVPGIMVGRQLMVIATVVSSALIYVIMRRMQFHRVFAVIAVVLFAASPLAIQNHRMVFLDNLQVMWCLAAMAFAVSPKRSVNSAIAAGLCLAVSTLSKETGGILLPVVVYLIWQNRAKGERSWSLSMFGASYVGLCSFYLMYAVLKNELFEGAGHVSLLYALKWQMFGRASTGSPLDPSSETYSMVQGWYDLDVWFLWAAVVLTVVGFMFRRTRALALGYAIQVALMFKGSYVPKAYAIVLIPFAALVIASVCSELYRKFRETRVRDASTRVRRIGRAGVVIASVIALVGTGASFGYTAVPQWGEKLRVVTRHDSMRHYMEMRAFVEKNIPDKHTPMAVDDNLWIDLKREGYSHADWFYKIDLDPEVSVNYPQGWRSIDYVIIDRLPVKLLKGTPSVYEAIQNSEKVFENGDDYVGYTVYKVDHSKK